MVTGFCLTLMNNEQLCAGSTEDAPSFGLYASALQDVRGLVYGFQETIYEDLDEELWIKWDFGLRIEEDLCMPNLNDKEDNYSFLFETDVLKL